MVESLRSYFRLSHFYVQTKVAQMYLIQYQIYTLKGVFVQCSRQRWE